MARRTAVTLIGSYVAFRTRTGSCISDARRNGIELWILLPAGPSEPGTAAPDAWGVWCPRDSTDSGRRALIALPSGYDSLEPITGRRVAPATVSPTTGLAPAPQRLGTGVAGGSAGHYIIS